MQTRTKVQLNHDWQFIYGRASRRWLNAAADVCDVDLPHCWNARDAFQDGVDYYRGWGSYRRCFELGRVSADTPRGRVRWRLVSEGFYGTGDVWLNGMRLGHVDGAYMGFTFDVTDRLEFDGLNRLGIRLTNRCRKSVLPGIRMPDFLLYGGMSGRLWLEGVPETRIDERQTHIGWDGDSARIAVVFTGEVTGSHMQEWRLCNADGVEVAKASTSAETAFLSLSIPNPHCWDVDDPHLYTAKGTLRCGESVVDTVTIRFGIRTAEFRPDAGFFLNGRRLPLRGCNRHESMPGFGRALPLLLHREDADCIKSMGLNFVRLSHYPQHPAFLDACDELGILVYAELASWKSVRAGRWLRNACRQMREMILRDRHHPAVILWGMGNEGRHRGAYRRLYSLCKQLDPQRAVTYAENHLYRARRKRTLGVPDVWGINYEFDAIKSGRDASLLRSVVISECSNNPHAQRGNTEEEARQLDMVREDVRTVEEASVYVAGFALWCFNDYATLRKQRYKRYSGIVDAWRIPKASAYWLAERFGGTLTTEPVLTGEPASSVVLHTKRQMLNAESRETIGISAEITDTHGKRCDWHGELKAIATGPGRLHPFDKAGTVVVAHGVGRLFVTATGDAGMIKVRVFGKNLHDGMLKLEAALPVLECTGSISEI